MSDDLVKRLLHYSALPASRASSARELCAEAAAALEAKDAEIAKLSENALEISKIYGRELDGSFRLRAEIAALKARLAAAEGLIAIAQPMVGNPQPNGAQWIELGRAATAYDALRAAQGEKP